MTDLRPNSPIADGIHWLQDRFVNNYIIEDNNELILIDTAFNKKAKGIMNYIRAELSDMKVAKIYITHHHMDHIRGLHTLDQHFHPRIYAHENDKPIIIGQEKSPLPRNMFLKPFFFILRPLTSATPVEQVELIEDGMKTDGLTVYHLPGHTMGSVGFMKNSVIFSGDAAVTKDNRVTPGNNMFAESVDLVYSSLRKLSELEFNTILPGHGAPILEDADQRVKEAVENLEDN